MLSSYGAKLAHRTHVGSPVSSQIPLCNLTFILHNEDVVTEIQLIANTCGKASNMHVFHLCKISRN